MAMNLQGGRRRRGRAPVSEINVTPLVDVMLVLLIIFMIAAPMMTSGVPVDLPDSKAKPLDQPGVPVEVSIDGKGRVYLGKDDITDSLASSFTEVARTRASDEPQVILSADRALDYGKVMQVMGELNRAGLNKVALVSKGQSGQ